MANFGFIAHAHGNGGKRIKPVNAGRLVRRNIKLRTKNLIKVRAAMADVIELPGQGESLHGIMEGNYTAWALTVALIHLAESDCKELYLSSLGLNLAQANSIAELTQAGLIGRTTLLISEYFAEANKSLWGRILKQMHGLGSRGFATRNHAKLALMQMADGRCITLETSANLRSSKNIEQFVITCDAELYAFHKGWIETLIDSDKDA
jgi:hypothetical protein